MNSKPEISEELNNALHALLKEILILHKRFQIFKDLYGTNEDYVTLLNKTSGYFFYLVQTGFIENIILAISRLSDPDQMKGFKNLSLKGIINLIDNEDLVNELNLQLDWYTSKTTDFLKTWRSKKIAHLDFDVAMSKAELQNEITIQNLDMAITAIRQFYNTIYSHYFGSKIVFESKDHSTTNSLLTSLEQARVLRQYVDDNLELDRAFPAELIVSNETFDFVRENKR